MKLNLECGTDLRNGYVNVSSNMINLPKLPPNTTLAFGNFKNLSHILEDDYAEEIIFNKPLNFIDPKDFVPTFKYWKEILSENGIIKVHFCDIRKLGRIIYHENISLQDIHNLLYSGSRTVIDTDSFLNMAKALEFTVHTLSSQNFIVSAELKNA